MIERSVRAGWTWGGWTDRYADSDTVPRPDLAVPFARIARMPEVREPGSQGANNLGCQEARIQDPGSRDPEAGIAKSQA